MLPKPTSPSVCSASRGRPGTVEPPRALARLARVPHHPPRAGEHERHRVVRHLLQAEVGDVDDEDPELGRVIDRDVVEADPVARDDEAAARDVERLGGHPLPVGQDRVAAVGERDELVRLAGLGHDELGTDLAEDPALDVERRPRVVGHEHSRGHCLNVSVVVARARVAAG